MNRPVWPQPAGRATMKAAETTASRAAALEAEAANLAQQMAADLIVMLQIVAAQANDLAMLNSITPDVRQLAERVAGECSSRAGSLRQLAKLPTPQPDASAS